MNRKDADTARRLGLPEARQHASKVLHQAEAERAELAVREDPHTSAVCDIVTHSIGSPDCQDDDCECSCHKDDTARRLSPSAWRDDWMPATKEALMDAPEPWRPDAIDDVIANWLAMSDYAHARDAYTAAQNLRGVLDSSGYTVAPRASQAATAPDSPGDDAGAAQGLHRPAVACTEPPHYLVETHDGHGWCTLAVYGNPDEARAHKIWANRGDRDRIVRVTREVTREVIQ